jgi:hypothetical protein
MLKAALTVSLASANTLYCPSASDVIQTWNQTTSPKIFDQGWTITGGGGVATKAAFNLLGGYVEYDIDFSRSNSGVNSNIYTISPIFHSSQGYNPADYCDAQLQGSAFCLEMDWVESNGNCGGATTVHSKEGQVWGYCSAYGCVNDYHYNGRSIYHMRLEYASDGTFTSYRDGQKVSYSNYNPQPTSEDSSIISSYNRDRGSVITSTQWTGWVPVEDCGTSGDLPSSTFTVTNLKIYGSIVQGPAPRSC